MTHRNRTYSVASMPPTADDPDGPTAYLRADGPDSYRWYDEDDLDTEVSGRNIAAAIRAARAAWPECMILNDGIAIFA